MVGATLRWDNSLAVALLFPHSLHWDRWASQDLLCQFVKSLPVSSRDAADHSKENGRCHCRVKQGLLKSPLHSKGPPETPQQARSDHYSSLSFFNSYNTVQNSPSAESWTQLVVRNRPVPVGMQTGNFHISTGERKHTEDIWGYNHYNYLSLIAMSIDYMVCKKEVVVLVTVTRVELKTCGSNRSPAAGPSSRGSTIEIAGKLHLPYKWSQMIITEFSFFVDLLSKMDDVCLPSTSCQIFPWGCHWPPFSVAGN